MTSRFKLCHALVCSISYYACSINCFLLAITVQLAAKTSIFSLFCRGLSRLKGLLFADKYCGAENREKL